MATKKDYYETGYDAAFIFDTRLRAQTFTATSSYLIGSVKVYVYKNDIVTGNVTVSIKATVAGVPSGLDLCSSVLPASDFPDTAANIAWLEFIFTIPISITSGITYAIVIKNSAADDCRIGGDNSGATYAGGMAYQSNDGGSNWDAYSGADHYFETYDYIQIVFGGNVPITSTLSATLNFAEQHLFGQISVTSQLSGSLTVTGIKLITGNIDIISELSGNLSITGTQLLQGNINILSFLTAILTGGKTIGWVLERPKDYDENLVWGYDDRLGIYRWIEPQMAQEIIAVSGSRYHQQLVIIGHKVVYFLEI
jgi:hypothetical protein